MTMIKHTKFHEIRFSTTIKRKRLVKPAKTIYQLQVMKDGKQEYVEGFKSYSQAEKRRKELDKKIGSPLDKEMSNL